MDQKDDLPSAFMLVATCAKRRVAIRISGGCKGMEEEDKLEMLKFFSEAFVGYEGVLFSGATRQTEDGKLDPMITDVPGVVVAGNPGSIALGTAPRTDLLRIKADCRLEFDDWGTVPNPSMSCILIVQNGPDGTLDWDGDVDAYFRAMENWQKYAQFSALGLIAWNGGDITKDEIMRSIGLKWPTILIKGSGRGADEIIELFEDEDPDFMAKVPDGHKIIVVDRTEPGDLYDALVAHGFLAED